MRDIGVFTNRHVGEVTQQKAAGIAARYGVPVTDISNVPNKLPQLAIVAGGEGSVRQVVEIAYRQKSVPTVGILGGGSNNVMFTRLSELGLSAAEEELPAFLDGEIPREFLFRPGVLKGDDGEEIVLFNNHVGLGAYERAVGTANEKLRFLPRQHHRSFASRLGAVALAIKPVLKGEEPLDVYTVSPKIGSTNAFPDQSLHGEDLTHAWVEGDRFQKLVKLLLTLFAWQQNTRPPSRILQTERRRKFKSKIVRDSVWIDGDTVATEPQEHVVFMRSSRAIPLFAIR